MEEAHRRGLKVVQDQVIGYTGPQHRWVTRPARPGLVPRADGPPPSCNFRFDAQANPHALESDRRGLTDGWFFGILPDMDTKDGCVNARRSSRASGGRAMFSADGLRLDTYPMVDRPFWRDWSKAQKD